MDWPAKCKREIMICHDNKTTITLMLALATSACSKTAAPEPRALTSEPAKIEAHKPAPAPLRQPSVLAVGTHIRVRIPTALSTRTHATGVTFLGELTQPLAVGGKIVAPAGSGVTGIVTESNPGGRIKGVAHMSVRLTHVQLPNGGELSLATDSLTFNAHKTIKRDGVVIGVTSGIGAAIGAIAGGGKGAAIGAGAGAGAGTAEVLATHGAPAVIPSESVLSFTLRRSITL